MPTNMGLGFGLERFDTVWKQKFRWLFKIPGISADGVQSLPPTKAARPTLSFREVEIQHVNETIFYPGKPEWKTVNLILYDIRCNQNPVFDWLRRLYDPQAGTYKFSVVGTDPRENFKQNAVLEMYDGCGNCIEKWLYDSCWPQTAEFQELDMAASDVMTVDLTLRYDRAYVVPCDNTLPTSDSVSSP